MQASKVLMLIGSALVNSKLGHRVNAIELDDVLGVMGLARRRSYLSQNLALLGVGVVVGAGVALLLAPASGSETRERLSKGAEKLSDQAAETLERVKRDASASLPRPEHQPHAVG